MHFRSTPNPLQRKDKVITIRSKARPRITSAPSPGTIAAMMLSRYVPRRLDFEGMDADGPDRREYAAGVHAQAQRIIASHVQDTLCEDYHVYLSHFRCIPLCLDGGDEVEDVVTTGVARLLSRYDLITAGNCETFLKRIAWYLQDPLTQELMTDAWIVDSGHSFQEETLTEDQKRAPNPVVAQLARLIV